MMAKCSLYTNIEYEEISMKINFFFQRMADEFKNRFFPEGTLPTSQEIEKLYWNIVQSADECVK